MKVEQQSFLVFLICTITNHFVIGEDVDVLILGAGASGISAGKTLVENGITNFKILEGRDQIGGRMRSAKLKDGTSVELGANWITGTKGLNGSPNNPILDIAKSIDLVTDKTDWDNLMTFDEKQGEVADKDVRWTDFGNAYECVLTLSERLQKQSLTCERSTDISLRVALQQCGWIPSSPMDFAVEWNTFDWDFAIRPESVGTLGANPVQEFEWEEEDLLVHDQEGGYVKVLEEMGKDFLSSKVVLNSKVTTVDYGGEKISVKSSNGETYTADQVIVTFSTGVLSRSINRFNNEDNVVQFTPEFPDWKKDVITKLPMGQFTKVFMQFGEAFWDEVDFLLFGAWDRSKFPTFLSLDSVSSFKNKHILVGFLVGQESWMADNRKQEDVVELAMNELRKLYPNAPEPQDFLLTNWAQDEWTYGAYTYRPVNVANYEALLLGQPLDNKLFFSGEATSPEMYGYVHGAYFQGKESALQVIACRTGKETEGVTCPEPFTNKEAIIQKYKKTIEARDSNSQNRRSLHRLTKSEKITIRKPEPFRFLQDQNCCKDDDNDDDKDDNQNNDDKDDNQNNQDEEKEPNTSSKLHGFISLPILLLQYLYSN